MLDSLSDLDHPTHLRLWIGSSSTKTIMASQRMLELTLVSGKDLKNVNLLSPLQIYAVAGFSSTPHVRQRTPTDREGRQNPTWNSTLLLPIPIATDTSRLTLDILLRADRSLGDRDVGEVHVPLADLESDAAAAAPGKPHFVSYQVRRLSGKGKGVLHIAYRFVDQPAPRAEPQVPVARAEEPVTAYPVFPQPYPRPGLYPASHSAYQQPSGAGAYGYAYAHAQNPGYGFGYAPLPAVRPQPAKNRLGMGLGAGLLGGVLGGLLIGDLVSDSAAYDAGYGAGFGDASFDF